MSTEPDHIEIADGIADALQERGTVGMFGSDGVGMSDNELARRVAHLALVEARIDPIRRMQAKTRYMHLPVEDEHRPIIDAITERLETHGTTGMFGEDAIGMNHLEFARRIALLALHDAAVAEKLPATTEAPHEALSRQHADDIEHPDPFASNVIYRAGEPPQYREALAKNTQNPDVLAQLAGDHIGQVALNVARNPHAKPSTLHHLATTDDRAASLDTRIAALENPNASPPTITEVWMRRDEQVMRQLLDHIHRYPSAPSGVVDLAYASGIRSAAASPNMSDGAIATALGDPDRVIDIVGNPKLTAEQLHEATELEYAALYENGSGEFEDQFEHQAMVWQKIATHPNTAVATLEKIQGHADELTRRAARDRLNAIASAKA